MASKKNAAVAETIEETTAVAEQAVEMVEETTEKAGADKKNIGGVVIGQVQGIPLWLINATYNHRTVFPRLKELGYTYIQLLRMAVGDNLEDRAKFIALVDEHESTPFREGDMTVQSLAKSILRHGQLAPINVQQLGTSDHRDAEGNVIAKKYGYAIESGNHRTMAMAYNFALNGYIHPSNPKQKKPFIKALLVRANKEESAKRSLDENNQRKQLTEWEIGEHVSTLMADGMTLDEIVVEHGKSVSYYKTCLAIYQPLVEGVDGKEVQEKLQRKEITKAEAVATVTGKAPAPSRTPRAMRTDTPKYKAEQAVPRGGDAADNSRNGPVNKVCSYANVLKMIDESPHDGKPTSVARIKAFAEVIGVDYETAIKASEARLQKAAATAV